MLSIARILRPVSLLRRRSACRNMASASSTTGPDGQAGKEIIKAGEEDLVEEEEIVISAFSQPQLLPEVPIKSLDLVKRIDKVQKKGSFAVDIFAGSYDEDFLTYPETLDNRKENLELKQQAAMVIQMYPQIWDDELQLQKFNFFNLFQLSVSEMMTIFEAIGSSSRKCYSETGTDPHLQQLQVTRGIISLITRNCLTAWPMFKSDNIAIKQLIPNKHILFGGSQDETSVYQRIAFCWSETAPTLGSLPPQEWQTLGESGGTQVDGLVITGKKTRILYDESVENFLVFYRDKFLAKHYETNQPPEDSNPASDPFAGACLLHKSEVTMSPVYHDSAGYQYVDLEFNQTVRNDRIVFPAQRKDPTAVNIKGLGQLATCSVIMGILKDALKMTYTHLINNKRGLLSCDIVEQKLTKVTSRIFAIESMVYYISGMYDGLEDGFDAHMETTIMKIMTNEYAYECLRELQHINGSDMFIVSKLQDQMNIFDSFLDGNVYNRLYLATMGIIWYARSRNVHLNKLRLAPWYPGYLMKTLLRERSERGDILTLNADIYGSLHPALKTAAENLEFVIKRVKYATEAICMQYGKDATAAQSALYKLAQLSIDTFMLTAMCARASKAYCNGSRNAEIDVSLATAFSLEVSKNVRLYMAEINVIPLSAFESKTDAINELNMKNGGYYAESPLDPNV